jgi:protoporphyrinogen/coproporphyrinogen III oxidase
MILIIGAGISGLTLAYEFQKKGIEYMIVESETKGGGYIKSIYKNNYLLELGPNTVLADDELKTFFYELGMNDQMLVPARESKKRYVLKNGHLKKLPSGPLSFLFGDFFSWETKKAIFRERNLKSSGKEQETVGEFFERRFNKELVDYAVDPFVSGIFAGDPYKVLIDKTFPFLPQLEKKYGSVIKGLMKGKANKKAKDSIVFKYGFDKVVNTLVEYISNIHFSTKVLSLTRDAIGFNVLVRQNLEEKTISVDSVIFTSPSFATSGILKSNYQELSRKIAGINYSPMVKIFLGFKKKEVGFYPEAYGVLNPSCEHQFSLGTIFNSSLNHDSSPEDHYLFTVMVGGVSNELNAGETDELILEKVSAELKRIYKIKSDPDFTYIHRIPNAIPQYDKNMLEIDSVVEELKKDNIYVCANWHKGAAVSDCIKKAIQLSESIYQTTPVI